MNVNEKLEELYQFNMELLKADLFDYNLNNNDKVTNPHLIKVSDKWENAQVKIMIVGQETYTWCGECGNGGEFSSNIEMSLKVYERFFLKEKGYSSPFWNEFRRIMNTVKSSKSIDYCWNNIIKIGRLGSGNIPEVNDIIKDKFDVVLEEIKITKPNIILFFTGPRYDNHIKRFIGNFKHENVEGFKQNELSSLKFENINLDLCLKTYHPNYLYRSGKKERVMNEIISMISSKVN